MPLLVGTIEQSPDEMRHRIVSDLAKVLPDVDRAQLDREVASELQQFGDPPVRQFLPVLVGRRVRDKHR